MKKQTNLRKNQSGIVSFMVVTIIMLVLTLIVLAFARLVRREQTQTLDRQLNAQAFYAAESGVNDALDALARPVPPTGYNNNCGGVGSFTDVAGLNSNLGNGVSYSCLLVDNSVPNLVVDSVPTGQSVVLPIRPQAGTINELEFVITATSGNTLTGCPATGNYPGSWPGGCSIGMLRMELVEFNGTPNRNNLLRNRAVAFIQPSSGGGGSPAFTWGQSSDSTAYNTGYRHSATCAIVAGAPRCTVNLTGPGLNIQNGYLRLRSIYRNVGVTVSARTSGGPVDLVGAQAEVDVTGRVSGVLKRIKVRAPIIPPSTGNPMPEFALHSTETICKRFQVTGPPANVLGFGIFLNSITGANDDCNPGQTANN
jgi:hypothetical protein